MLIQISLENNAAINWQLNFPLDRTLNRTFEMCNRNSPHNELILSLLDGNVIKMK